MSEDHRRILHLETLVHNLWDSLERLEKRVRDLEEICELLRSMEAIE